MNSGKRNPTFWRWVVGLILGGLTVGSFVDPIPGDEIIATLVAGAYYAASIYSWYRGLRAVLPAPASTVQVGASASQLNSLATFKSAYAVDAPRAPAAPQGAIAMTNFTPPVQGPLGGQYVSLEDIQRQREQGLLDILLDERGAAKLSAQQLVALQQQAKQQGGVMGSMLTLLVNPQMPSEARQQHIDVVMSAVPGMVGGNPDQIRAIHDRLMSVPPQPINVQAQPAGGAPSGPAAPSAPAGGDKVPFWRRPFEWWSKRSTAMQIGVIVLGLGLLCSFGMGAGVLAMWQVDDPTATALPTAPVGLTLQTGGEAAGEPTAVLPPTVASGVTAPATNGVNDIVVVFDPSYGSLYDYVAVTAGYDDYANPGGKFAGCVWPWVSGGDPTSLTAAAGVQVGPNTAELSGYRAWSDGGRGSGTIFIPGALIDACGR